MQNIEDVIFRVCPDEAHGAEILLIAAEGVRVDGLDPTLIGEKLEFWNFPGGIRLQPLLELVCALRPDFLRCCQHIASTRRTCSLQLRQFLNIPVQPTDLASESQQFIELAAWK